jgi:23S rRNA pseudouridine1911/1915/1917 synthase
MAVVREGRSAASEWEVVETFGSSFALLRVRIHSGRTHQIRVHLAHIGFPVSGDPLYGTPRSPGENDVFPRCMLHAHRLGFTHPEDGRELEIVAPLPEDFRNVIEHLRERN